MTPRALELALMYPALCLAFNPTAQANPGCATDAGSCGGIPESSEEMVQLQLTRQHTQDSAGAAIASPKGQGPWSTVICEALHPLLGRAAKHFCCVFDGIGCELESPVEKVKAYLSEVYPNVNLDGVKSGNISDYVEALYPSYFSNDTAMKEMVEHPTTCPNRFQGSQPTYNKYGGLQQQWWWYLNTESQEETPEVLPGKLSNLWKYPKVFYNINWYDGTLKHGAFVNLFDPSINKHVNGFPNNSVVEIIRNGFITGSNRTFYVYLAPGSGVAVSLGKNTVVAKNKMDFLVNKLKIPISTLVSKLRNSSQICKYGNEGPRVPSNIGSCKPPWIAEAVPYFDVFFTCASEYYAGEWTCPSQVMSNQPLYIQSGWGACPYCSVKGVTCNFSTTETISDSIASILSNAAKEDMLSNAWFQQVGYNIFFDNFIDELILERGITSVQLTTQPNAFGGWGYEIVMGNQTSGKMIYKTVGNTKGDLTIEQIVQGYASNQGIPVPIEDMPDCLESEKSKQCSFCANLKFTTDGYAKCDSFEPGVEVAPPGV